MAKEAATEKGKRTKRRAIKPDKTAEATNAMLERMALLEDEIETLKHKHFYSRLPVIEPDKAEIAAAQDRFVGATKEGWLEVLIGGARQPLPSGTKVALTQTSGGRDYGIVSEGAFEGSKFEVTSGYLENTYRRFESLVAKLVTRGAGPVTIGGVAYELELTLTYKEGSAVKSSGPYPARTDPTNPLPAGNHDLEIADFPHPKGSSYGQYGMTWFRIGHSGDRYLHPGQGSLGCITCAPANWTTIYHIVHPSRSNSKSTGTLTFRP